MTQTRAIDTTQSMIITDANTYEPSTPVQDKDNQRIGVYPAFAYEGQNLLPTAYGYKSFFGVDAKQTADGLPDGLVIHDYFVYQTSRLENVHVALTNQGIFTRDSGDNDWAQTVVMGTPAEGTDFQWTKAVIKNVVFIYRQDQTVFHIIEEYADVSTGSQGDWDGLNRGLTGIPDSQSAPAGAVPSRHVGFEAITPTFINMAGQIGIFRAGSTLGFWDSEDAVAWSALANLGDFKPSTTSLANITSIAALVGKITMVLGFGKGFIIYATKSIILAEENAASAQRFRASPVFTNVGVVYPREVVAAQPDNVHFAWSTAGLLSLELGQNPQFIVPEISDYIRQTRTPVYLTFLNNRYLCLQLLDKDFIEGNVQFSAMTIDPEDLKYQPKQGQPVVVDGVYVPGNEVCFDRAPAGLTSNTEFLPYIVAEEYDSWFENYSADDNGLSYLTGENLGTTLNFDDQGLRAFGKHFNQTVLTSTERDFTNNVGLAPVTIDDEDALAAIAQTQIDTFLDQAGDRAEAELMSDMATLEETRVGLETVVQSDDFAIVYSQPTGQLPLRTGISAVRLESLITDDQLALIEGQLRAIDFADADRIRERKALIKEVQEDLPGNWSELAAYELDFTLEGKTKRSENFPVRIDAGVDGKPTVFRVTPNAADTDTTATMDLHMFIKDPLTASTGVDTHSVGGVSVRMKGVGGSFFANVNLTGDLDPINAPVFIPAGTACIEGTADTARDSFNGGYLLRGECPISASYRAWGERVISFGLGLVGTTQRFGSTDRVVESVSISVGDYADKPSSSPTVVRNTTRVVELVDPRTRTIELWGDINQDAVIAQRGELTNETPYGGLEDPRGLVGGVAWRYSDREEDVIEYPYAWVNLVANSNDAGDGPTGFRHTTADLGLTQEENGVDEQAQDVNRRVQFWYVDEFGNRVVDAPSNQGQVCGVVDPIDLPPIVIPPVTRTPWTVEIPQLSWLLQNGSPAPLDPTFEAAFVFDTQLQKWGNLIHDYKLLVDYQPVAGRDTTGVISYQNFMTDAGVILPSLELAIFNDTPEVSYIRYGKYRHWPVEQTSLETVQANFREKATGYVTVQTSYNGRSLEYGASFTLQFQNKLQANLGCATIGKWHTITIGGHFDLTRIDVVSQPISRR